jgi:hypothetical protein
MERAERWLFGVEVGVKFFCALESIVKEYFSQAVGQLMGNCRSLDSN